MKKLFAIFIPLCIVSFIAFGISVAILGKTEESSMNSVMESGENVILEEIKSSGNISEKFDICPNIELRTAGINAIVQPTDEQQAYIDLENPDNKDVYVMVSTDSGDSTLSLEIHPSNISFFDSNEFGIVNWLDDIFGGETKITVNIYLPRLIYDGLVVEHGSGSLEINDVYASGNDIQVGSGKLSYERTKSYLGNYLNITVNSGNVELRDICNYSNCYNVNSGSLDATASKSYLAANTTLNLGSGYAKITNAGSEEFDLDIGSGKFEINGISGEGSIQMGSGYGSISYLDVNNYTEIDMGSGNLDIKLPKNITAVADMDIGSGVVDVNYGGTNKAYHESDSIIIGEKYGYLSDDDVRRFSIDMGSGHISIEEMDKTAEEYRDSIESESGELTVITPPQVTIEEPQSFEIDNGTAE